MSEFNIDCDFPGGNIVLEKTAKDTVFLRQDLRDTAGDWFYWAFRIRGAAGRRLKFNFTDGDVLGVRGPAVSTDGGSNWQWLGADSATRTGGEVSFSYDFAPDAEEVFLAFCPLYTQKNLDAFLARPSSRVFIKRDVLCRSRAGRDVELLCAGGASAPYRVLLTARQHACETMGSFCLEGIMEAACGEDDLGHWLRSNVNLSVVPFMDKDGVEAGDQGKNRRPYDHNRDYGGELLDSIYPETRSLRHWAQAWTGKGKTALLLDIHCPWIRGDRNEDVYFVGVPEKRIWHRVTRFSRVLEAGQSGPLPYREVNNLPHGVDWNTLAGQGLGAVPCARWGCGLPGIHFSTSVEVPYANAGGAEVTPDSARALGRDIAVAIRTYLSGLDSDIS